MKKGDNAEITMQKTLCTGKVPDRAIYSCELLKYDETCEYIYFLLKSGELTDLSLDAIYECEIHSETESLNCTGKIRERYNSKEGKTLKIRIENGFYKINRNGVDKQMA